MNLVPRPPYNEVSEQQSNAPDNSFTPAYVPTGTNPEMPEPPGTFASCPDIHQDRVVGALGFKKV